MTDYQTAVAAVVRKTYQEHALGDKPWGVGNVADTSGQRRLLLGLPQPVCRRQGGANKINTEVTHSLTHWDLRGCFVVGFKS